MITNNEHAPHPVESTKVYRLNGVPFLPHYTIAGTYVSPGNSKTRREYTEKLLINLGAVPDRMDIWPRRYA